MVIYADQDCIDLERVKAAWHTGNLRFLLLLLDFGRSSVKLGKAPELLERGIFLQTVN
jgi:hypothetical protein